MNPPEENDSPNEDERDAAFVAGWNSEKIGANPFPQDSTLARIFVDGWAMRIKINKLGLEP